jgi:hypothetical protein
MKTIKLFAWFFGTFFGAMLTLSLCIALVTWTPVYDVIHSGWSVLTIVIAVICAIAVTADVEENM